MAEMQVAGYSVHYRGLVYVTVRGAGALPASLTIQSGVPGFNIEKARRCQCLYKRRERAGRASLAGNSCQPGRYALLLAICWLPKCWRAQRSAATSLSCPRPPAGHMVPQSKPAEALEMFSRFLERMQI